MTTNTIANGFASAGDITWTGPPTTTGTTGGIGDWITPTAGQLLPHVAPFNPWIPPGATIALTIPVQKLDGRNLLLLRIAIIAALGIEDITITLNGIDCLPKMSTVEREALEVLVASAELLRPREMLKALLP